MDGLSRCVRWFSLGKSRACVGRAGHIQYRAWACVFGFRLVRLESSPTPAARHLDDGHDGYRYDYQKRDASGEHGRRSGCGGRGGLISGSGAVDDVPVTADTGRMWRQFAAYRLDADPVGGDPEDSEESPHHWKRGPQGTASGGRAGKSMKETNSPIRSFYVFFAFLSLLRHFISIGI